MSLRTKAQLELGRGQVDTQNMWGFLLAPFKPSPEMAPWEKVTVPIQHVRHAFGQVLPIGRPGLHRPSAVYAAAAWLVMIWGPLPDSDLLIPYLEETWDGRVHRLVGMTLFDLALIPIPPR